jgi:enoyl-CoA hydratase
MENKMIETFKEDGIGFLTLNRPDKLNALSMKLLEELRKAVEELDNDDEISVVIMKGKGRAFCAGLDFYDFLQLVQKNMTEDREKIKNFLYESVVFMQESIASINRSKKIYIAAIHGFCVGGGLDIASTCDIRLATKDSVFSIMETKIGVVDDLGAIQYLPKIIGEGNTRLLAYTARKIQAKEALRIGLVSEVYENEQELMKKAKELALEIMKNPKDALAGTKEAMNYGLDHSVEESLRFAARFNSTLFNFEEVKNRFLNNVKKS